LTINKSKIVKPVCRL